MFVTENCNLSAATHSSDLARLSSVQEFTAPGDTAAVASQYQTLVLVVLLCLAVAAAVIAALAVTNSSRSAKAAKTAMAAAAAAAAAVVEAEAACGSQSAPVTRQQSYARLDGAKFASFERLDRFQLVDGDDGDRAAADAADAADSAAAVVDEAELRFCTKLDLLEGILYLHSFRLRLRATATGDRQLEGSRAIIDVRDGGGGGGGVGGGGCQRWRIEADLMKAPDGFWGTEAMDYVASLRLHGSRQMMPHEHQLAVSASVIVQPSLQPTTVGLAGWPRFPVHLANEPNMEFGVTMSAGRGEPILKAATSWRQLRPIPAPRGDPPRLHLGLLFSPCAGVSAVSVRLVEVFGAVIDADCVTAAVALLTGAPAAAEAAAESATTLTARPVGPGGAFAFDRRAAPLVLAIDSRRLQSAGVGVGVALSVGGGREAWRVQLGDFARAGAPSGMRQWNAALSNPNRWIWLTHACR